MRIVAIIGILASFVLAAFPATAENSITGIRTGGSPDKARLVVETSQEIPYSFFLLSNPYRLVIDMPDTRWQVENRGTSGSLQTPPIQGYRFGSPQPGTSRLVIDLDGPATPVEAFRLPPNGLGHRLVIDLSLRGDTAFQLAATALKQQRGKPLQLDQGQPRSSRQLAMLMPQPRPERANPGRSLSGMLLPLPRPKPKVNPGVAGKWVVFIDAGHGGKDPGAIGVSGIREKDITLKAAHELARQMNATGRIRAVLSRDKDHYHKLRKRIALARQAQADIFISLHADAAHNRKARGVSVFTLSDKASDKEAELLAAQENKADLVGGPDLDTTDPEITSALLGMFQRESMNQSAVLAAAITRSFDGLPTSQRGHRFAGFAVLKAPDIPSVLIEMGFLTNRKDERNLVNKGYRRDLMRRITEAVLTYLEESNIPVLETLP